MRVLIDHDDDDALCTVEATRRRVYLQRRVNPRDRISSGRVVVVAQQPPSLQRSALTRSGMVEGNNYVIKIVRRRARLLRATAGEINVVKTR